MIETFHKPFFVFLNLIYLHLFAFMTEDKDAANLSIDVYLNNG